MTPQDPTAHPDIASDTAPDSPVEPTSGPESTAQPEPEPAAPQFLTQAPEPLRDPFWGWHDLFLFIFVTVASLGGAMLAAMGIKHFFHVGQSGMNIVMVIAQFGAYGLAFAALKLMFHAEYDRPFWASLHWLPSYLQTGTTVGLGMTQAVVVALLSTLVRAPEINTPMNQLMADRSTAIVIAFVGVCVAPVAEELAFRGLLQPLLIRSIGVLPGILVTAMLFGALHLEQYGFTWQSLLLISTAGAGFGVMRYRTGSTRASALMHAGYNSTLFMLFFLAKGQQH